jgi:hypothetical protein
MRHSDLPTFATRMSDDESSQVMGYEGSDAHAGSGKEGSASWRPESFPADRFRINKGRPLSDGSYHFTLSLEGPPATYRIPFLTQTMSSQCFFYTCADIIQYFLTIGNDLERVSEMDADERTALLSNLWAEVRGREFRLATKKDTALILERLIDISTYSQVKTFLRALAHRYYAFFVHHNASHCMQRVLMRAPEILLKEHLEHIVVPWDESVLAKEGEDDEDEDDADRRRGGRRPGSSAAAAHGADTDAADAESVDAAGPPRKTTWDHDMSLQDIIADMCRELGSLWLDLMSNPQASYVMRSLILVLAGHTGVNKNTVARGTESVHAGNNNAAGARRPVGPAGASASSVSSVLSENDENAVFLALVGQSRAHVRHLKGVLPQMVALIERTPVANVHHACFDPCVMPVLKALVRAVGARVRKVSHAVTVESLIARLLGWKLDESASAAAKAEAEAAAIEAATVKARAGDGDADSDADSSSSDDDDDDKDEEEEESKDGGKKKKSTSNGGDDDDDDSADGPAPTSNLVWQLGSGAMQHVNAMLRDPVGSHLLEAIFLAAPPAVVQSFLYKHTQGRLLALAHDRSGNHVVQRIFSALRDEASFTLCYEQIKDDIMALVRGQRAGVVWHAVEAARRIGCRQSAVAKQVMAAFGGQRKGAREGRLVLDVLTLNAHTPEEEDEGRAPRGGAEFVRGQYLGSQLLSALFSLPPQSAAPFYSSLTSLPGPTLLAVLRDPVGARAVGAYIASKASQREKCKLARKICSSGPEGGKDHNVGERGSAAVSGTLGTLVCQSAAAGFVVEALYLAVDAENRTRISRELAAAERKIAVSKGGLNLLRRLRIAEYKQTGTIWDGVDRATPSASAAGARSKGEKKADINKLFADVLPKKGAARADDDENSDVEGADAAAEQQDEQDLPAAFGGKQKVQQQQQQPAKQQVKRSHDIDEWASTGSKGKKEKETAAKKTAAAAAAASSESEDSESESGSEEEAAKTYVVPVAKRAKGGFAKDLVQDSTEEELSSISSSSSDDSEDSDGDFETLVKKQAAAKKARK